MIDERYDVTHSDGTFVEVVRDLDVFTARRLVEHELNAGRIASMDEHQQTKGRTYR